VRSLDTALQLVAALALDNDERWGSRAADWQWADMRAVLDPASPTPYHFLTRARGGAKTGDLAAASIAILLTQAPLLARCYGAAVDEDQAAFLIDAIAGFVARAPSLRSHLKVESRRVVNVKSGATLEALASNSDSAWGLKPYLVVADELASWPTTRNARSMWDALVSAMPKVDGSRLVCLTTAGDPAHWSHRVLQHARASKLWRVNEVRGPVPWIAETLLDEQRCLLTESQFARLHENRWIAAEDRLVRPEDLRACVTLDGPLDPVAGTTYIVGVDVGLRHDRTAVSVCHAETTESGRRVVLDRMLVLQGSRRREVQLADVEAAIVQASSQYGRAHVRIDPWQAIGLAQRLRVRGVAVEEYPFSAQSVGRLASTLHLLLRDRLLAIPDDEALLDELANVRLRETSPGVLRIDHDPDKFDDRAISLALAATALVERVTTPVQFASPRGLRLDAPLLPSIAGRRTGVRR
jgi:phage terminase large subunit-like protein